MIKFVENLRNALYGVFVTDKNTRYEEYQDDSRRKYEAYIDFLVKENEELKAQIEKMKCCQNCELYDCTSECKNKKCKYQYSEICRDKTMIDKWELSE